MNGKTAIVTGANTGIGLETAASLAEMGADVVLTARNDVKGAAAVEEIKRRHPETRVATMHLDLSDLKDVRDFTRRFHRQHDRLDVLVNNAGLMVDKRSLTNDGFETMFQVNHLGPFLLTNLLIDLIKRSAPARIVNVASVAHRTGRLDLDDLQSEKSFGGMSVYGMTKLCNILFTRELARRLERTGVTANSVHPGTVRTGFAVDGDTSGFFRLLYAFARPFLLSPGQGAKTQIMLASSPDVEGVTGEYWVRSKPQTASAAAQDDEAARKLWDASAKLVGLA